MQNEIARQKELGKMRMSETYTSALNSFKLFRNGKDLPLSRVDSSLMVSYECYLKARGVSPNTSSFYLRNLRAVYNRAVEQGLTLQRFPFKHVYTGVGKTMKRAVSLEAIRKMKVADFSSNPALDFSRDMFLFSFYTRGMSLVDMAYLRKKDLSDDVLSYRRQKTGQQLFVKWEACMQDIVDKYATEESPYLLPLIRPALTHIPERNQYLNARHKINRCLKKISCSLDLSAPLTMYVARHTWASTAKSMNIPISVISEAMGHDSESTTRIYLASLERFVVDEANRKILDLL